MSDEFFGCGGGRGLKTVEEQGLNVELLFLVGESFGKHGEGRAASCSSGSSGGRER